jgi:hypothetical protein
MFHHTSAVAVLITYTHLGVTMYVIGLSRWFSPLTVFRYSQPKDLALARRLRGERS